MSEPRPYSQILFWEWIIYRFAEVTTVGDLEPMFVRTWERPLDESMRLAGGSIKVLDEYLAYYRREKKL